MSESSTSYDQVLDDLCKHIIARVDPVQVTMLDDYDDAETSHGYNPNGGPAYCTMSRQLISAAARIRCRVDLPALPDG